MAQAHRKVGWLLLAIAAVSSGGCASSTAPSQPPPQRAAAQDLAAYDWHLLIPVPFGTLLKDLPFALTEVVMFRDTAEAARASDDRDCYTMERASPPRFLGQTPSDYLLCFDHDRLNRIEASLILAADDAEATLAEACAAWLPRANTAARVPDGCDGREGSTEWSARLRAGDPAPSAGAPAPSSTAPSTESSSSHREPGRSTISISLVDAARSSRE